MPQTELSASRPAALPDAVGCDVLICRMLDALDANDSENYWSNFEALLKLHQRVLSEPTPELVASTQPQDGVIQESSGDCEDKKE